MNSNRRNTYDPEFIKKAIKLALSSSRPISVTAKELGLKDSTLHTWISKEKVKTQSSSKYQI